MPIYEYQIKKGYGGCEKCKEPFEMMQKITDSPLEKCLECKSPLKKIISRSSFVFNGGYTAKNNYSLPLTRNNYFFIKY